MKNWSRIIVPSLGLLFELMGNPIYLRVLFLKHSLYLIYIFRSDFCYITLTDFVFEVDALFERSNCSIFFVKVSIKSFELFENFSV